MVFHGRLESVKKEVEQGLVGFFAKKRQEAKQISSHTLMLVDEVAEFTMRGGKRTRAFLCWLGHRSVISAQAGTKSTKSWIPDQVGDDVLLSAMMALELFQSFALIHDDIIDRDTVRRGGPTIHVQVGVPIAILAGDLALAWADEMMTKAGGLSTPDVRLRLRHTSGVSVMKLYHQMKEEVILGQSLDVLASVGLPSADRLTINRYKTAWYSVIRPLQIGAVISGADTTLLEAFVPYGLAVGQAYQLRDDLLDRAIGKGAFDHRARILQKQALRAIKNLKVPHPVTALLVGFARFAGERRV